MKTFKEEKTITERKQESCRILRKYPGRIPIIVEKSKGCKRNLILDKKKYLVPQDLTLGQFTYIIRKRLSIKSEE